MTRDKALPRLLPAPPRAADDSTRSEERPKSLDVPVTESIAASSVMHTFLKIIRERQIRSTVLFEPLAGIRSGGEAYVFRALRRGSEDFSAISAVKVFSPAIYANEDEYLQNMHRISKAASTVVQIQHNHIVDVLDFSEHEGVRFMVMEWIDGFDLAALMSHMTDECFRTHMSRVDVQSLRDVIFAIDNDQGRMRPGVAVYLLRQCLSALAALHRKQLVHGDVKLSNIMLNRTGNTKLIDIGSSDSFRLPKRVHAITPRFAAPELLLGSPQTPQADLASLGYAFITLLTGQDLFAGITAVRDLYEAKRWLSHNLRSILPEDVCRCEGILSLCERLIAVDQARRVASAESAIRSCDSINHQLVEASLDCDYEEFLRQWLNQYKPLAFAN